MSKIVVAQNAGFCFGVARAVDSVNETIGKYRHIYTYGELIHNKDVIVELEKKGVRITEDIDSVPQEESTVIIIRSHGVPKAVYQKIENRGFELLDLTCPFVARIHNRVIEAGDMPVVIIGAEDHPEVTGIKGWAQGPVYVVNTAEDAATIPSLDEALVVAQTTITHDLWDEIVTVLRERIVNLELFNSICDTTQKRQKEAVELAKKSDIVLVVGGKHSSNTEKLYKLCKNNCQKTYYIDNIAELPLENVTNHDIISIVAGASTPDRLIREVKTLMSDVEKVVDAEVAEETEVSTTEQEQSQANEDFMAEIEKSFVYIKRGQIVTGTVVQISDSEICVNIGYKSDGIIKKENLTASGDANPQDLFKVGDEIEAEVVTLNDGEGNVVLSRRSIESKLKWKELVESLDETAVYTVKVDKVVKGGVLAKLEGYDAFIPASQLSLKYVEDLNEFVGKELEVNIIEADKRQRRFVLSHKNILKVQAEEQEKKLYETFKKGDKVT
ncbi:MAG: 4-hydroxy-3-methylbut-2-enyl diphosphate reductase, partial [Christensenella hongkongensis]